MLEYYRAKRRAILLDRISAQLEAMEIDACDDGRNEDEQDYRNARAIVEQLRNDHAFQPLAIVRFLKFVFGPMPVWRYFRYQMDGTHWCPRRLVWTFDLAPPELETYPAIWIRRARRWFQGKRDHQIP